MASVSTSASDPPSATTGEDPRRALGRLGEQLAATHLERLGYAIVAHNIRTRYGEIDLIASKRYDLVFVEVKTRRLCSDRRHSPGGQPLAWLHASQRTRLRRLAAAWLQHNRSGVGRYHRPSARTIRFDAVGVTVDEADRLLRLDHIESAW